MIDNFEMMRNSPEIVQFIAYHAVIKIRKLNKNQIGLIKTGPYSAGFYRIPRESLLKTIKSIKTRILPAEARLAKNCPETMRHISISKRIGTVGRPFRAV